MSRDTTSSFLFKKNLWCRLAAMVMHANDCCSSAGDLLSFSLSGALVGGFTARLAYAASSSSMRRLSGDFVAGGRLGGRFVLALRPSAYGSSFCCTLLVSTSCGWLPL